MLDLLIADSQLSQLLSHKFALDLKLVLVVDRFHYLLDILDERILLQ